MYTIYYIHTYMSVCNLVQGYWELENAGCFYTLRSQGVLEHHKRTMCMKERYGNQSDYYNSKVSEWFIQSNVREATQIWGESQSKLQFHKNEYYDYYHLYTLLGEIFSKNCFKSIIKSILYNSLLIFLFL